MQFRKIISAWRISNKQQPSLSLIEAINKLIAESLETTVLGESVVRIRPVGLHRALPSLFFSSHKDIINHYQNTLSILLEVSYSGCSPIANMVCGSKIVVYSFYLILKMFLYKLTSAHSLVFTTVLLQK